MTESRSKIRVVLIEDQALVQTALASLIDAADGLEVVATGGTVAEAVRLAQELQPDVVLMGVLAEQGTFAACGEILQRCPAAKVILLDQRSLDANVREALRVRAAGYLTKQQPFHQIENSLRRAARGDRVFAPDIAARLVLSAEGVRLAADNTASPLASLTPRETDVLIHLAQGYSVKQCAKALGIGTSTAGNHKSRLMKKLNVHKTVDLTRLAIREGLVSEGRGELLSMPVRDPPSADSSAPAEGIGRSDDPRRNGDSLSAWSGQGALDGHVEQSRAGVGGQGS